MSGDAADIAVVLHDLALGGTERAALRLAGAWARAGRRVRLVCGDPRGPARAWLDPAVERIALDPPVPRGPGARTRLGRALAEELGARPARVLFVPGNHHWPVIAPVTALAASVRPKIVAQVSNPLRRPDRSPLRRAWSVARARRRLAGVDALVTLTEAEALAADRLLGRAVARRIPLPVLDDGAPPPAPPAVGGSVTLCLGRLVRQKRWDRALRAFRRADVAGARLVFVGEGPEQGRLARLAARLDLADRVEFAGAVEDVGPVLERARVLLLPSDFEGYGAVVVEALAAGRPVVATDRVPAAVELVDRPDRGAVTPAGDERALAAALRGVLTAPATALDAEGLDAFRLGPAADAYLTLFDSLARPGPQRG